MLDLTLSVVLLYLDLGAHKIESRMAALFSLHCVYGYVNLCELGWEYESALINLNLLNRLNYQTYVACSITYIIKEHVQHQNKLYKSSYK